MRVSKGAKRRQAKRPPVVSTHDFKRARLFAAKVAAIHAEHAPGSLAARRELETLVPYTSRGHGKGKGRFGCRRGSYLRPNDHAGKAQNRNPDSRECKRRARQQEAYA